MTAADNEPERAKAARTATCFVLPMGTTLAEATREALANSRRRTVLIMIQPGPLSTLTIAV